LLKQISLTFTVLGVLFSVTLDRVLLNRIWMANETLRDIVGEECQLTSSVACSVARGPR